MVKLKENEILTNEEINELLKLFDESHEKIKNSIENEKENNCEDLKKFLIEKGTIIGSVSEPKVEYNLLDLANFLIS